MNEKGIAKSTMVIIIVLLIAVLGIVFFVFNKDGKLEYFRLKGYSECEGVLIDNYKDFSKLVSDSKLDKEMESAKTYKWHVVLEYFNEAFFAEKKIAVISTYEDTSKDYVFSIDEVIYNETKTSATINYTDKVGGYAGTLDTSWENYMIVELEPTVTEVKFVKANKGVSEK